MIESACTIHICNNRESIVELQETTVTIQVGNKEEIAEKGVGSFQVFYILNGKTISLTLQNVLYSPDIIYSTRKNDLHTEIDDDARNPMKALFHMIHKKSKSNCMIAYETNEGLYEALLSVKKGEKVKRQ